MPKRSAQGLSAGPGHRRRLIAAMVEVVAGHGYGGATVSRVVERAGVSRATFYEHFPDRDECFLAAYRASLASVRETVRRVAEASTSAERPEAVLEVLLDQLSANPAVARLVLVEALGAAAVRGEHEELIGRIDGEIAAFLDRQPGERALQLPATALLGGVGEVLATRVLAGEGGDLRVLRGELATWIAAYRLPSGTRPLPQRQWEELGRFSRVVRRQGPSKPGLLPRGRSALPPEAAAEARRRRILDATARIAAEGYKRLTVASIAAAARVPRSAFYAHFDNKEEALLAVQTEGMQEAMAVAAAAYSPSAPWPRRVWRSLAAFLGFVAENPALARVDFVESYAAGRAATRHRQQNRMVFALFLEEGYRQGPRAARLPHFCSEAIAAAMFGLMRKLVIEGRTEQMLSILPAAAYTVLAPFIGAEEAAAQVRSWSRVA